jgi:hypothetical protein
MVGNEKKRPEATKPESKSVERVHGIPQPHSRQSVTAASDDCVPSSANSPNQSVEREHGVQPTHPQQSAAPDDGVPSSANSSDKPNDVNDGGQLMKTLGETNPEFVGKLVGQLVEATRRGPDEVDDQEFFLTLGALKGAKAGDELVAMQIAQMGTINAAVFRASGQLARAETVLQQESATRALTQLARTFTAQLDALNRYRNGAHQVTVQNVSVNDGGQAIVGNVTQGAPATPPQELANVAPALTDSRQPAMEIIGEPERVTAPPPAKQRRGER